MLRNVRGEVKAFGEDLAECLRTKLFERAKEIGGQVGRNSRSVEVGNRNEADGIIRDCAAEHAPEDCTLDLLLGHCADGKHSDDRQQHREDRSPGRRAGEDVEGGEVHECCAVVDDDARVLEADEGDEQADTGGDGRLDGCRDGIEDHLAKAGDGKQNENDAVNEDENKTVRVAQAEGEADGVDKKCVQTHAGGLRQREVREKTDQNRADDGGNRGCDVDRAVAHGAEACEHAGIDHQNVGHCHEGGHTGHNLGAHGRAVFLHFKVVAHGVFLPFFHAARTLCHRHSALIIGKKRTKGKAGGWDEINKKANKYFGRLTNF